MTGRSIKLLPLLLAAVTAASCLLCFLCYHLDNKYTHPHPYANLGVIEPDMDRFHEAPLFYLVDGWGLYENKFLSPLELAGHTPDTYLYLGQYGGFDLGDPSANPHGQGTYRTVILLDGTPRQYALELPPIYSRWQLWVNGELLQSKGMGDDLAPHSAMTTFPAAGQVEIVVAVADDTGFYSGMVYPPAFGSLAAVEKIASLRLLLHGLFMGGGLLLAALCLLVGMAQRLRGPYPALALLCLCFCLSTAWPVFQALGLTGTGWLLAERIGYYGLFLALIWVQGRLCAPPKVLWYPALALGGLVCLSLLLQPLIPVTTAAPLLAYSNGLALWKWLCAGWLLAVALWGSRRRNPNCPALLCGACLFAAALGMDQCFPLHEPIVLGWFVEIAGGLLILLFAAVLWRDTARVYREEGALRVALAVRAERERLQQDYVRATREQLHHSRSQLTLLSHYLAQEEFGKLRTYLDSLLEGDDHSDPRQYTGNNLVDAVLTVALNRAAGADIYVELRLSPLDETLPYADEDMTCLLTNLLDNAIEGALGLSDPDDRWLSLEIEQAAGLTIVCSNAAPQVPASQGTSKSDKQAHGFGLVHMGRIARRYGGSLETAQLEDTFSIIITLALVGRDEEVTP